jgi:transposase
MVVFGIDAHKRSHTVVAVDGQGRRIACRTLATTTGDHLELVAWARRLTAERDPAGPRVWAVEDCRHLSRRLERDLLSAGEAVVRVTPKLMAATRNSARGYGKSDPIDALAVARAALREPDLPTARLDGPERALRLLVDHRENLVTERTRTVCRLRWLLHELDPATEPPPRSLDRASTFNTVEEHLRTHTHGGHTGGHTGTVVRLARGLLDRCRDLTAEIDALTEEITTLVTPLAPTLLAIRGVGPLTAAKILGETAGIHRFHSRHAYARHNGTAPLPVWSSGQVRHRLARTGNRQLNTAIHRIALTQARWHQPARELIARRRTAGNGPKQALRCLKRHLSDAVYQALRTDQTHHHTNAA